MNSHVGRGGKTTKLLYSSKSIATMVKLHTKVALTV